MNDGGVAALFVVHGPATLVASRRAPCDQVNCTSDPENPMARVTTGGVAVTVAVTSSLEVLSQPETVCEA
jgi:hypothetical protein